MNEALTKIAQACLEGAESNSMTFPEIVGALMQGGFESYAVDFRRASATYYLPDGDSVVLPAHRSDSTIAANLFRPRSGKRNNWCRATLMQAFA